MSNFWKGFEKQAGKIGNYITSLDLPSSRTQELRGKLAKNIVKARRFLRSRSAPLEKARGVGASFKNDDSKFTIGSAVTRKGTSKWPVHHRLDKTVAEVKDSKKVKKNPLAPAYKLIGPV